MLESLKKEVCEIAKKAQQDGLCKHKTGNFSARDKESGYIVITPTGVDRDALTPRDMVVMDINARVVENAAGLKPTSEALMHLMVYKQRDDIFAVSHTHSLYATAFAVMGKSIPAIVYEVANLGLKKGYVPLAPYGRPGTPELATSIITACLKADAFLIEKHGAVTIGETMYDAFLKSAFLEELAQLYHIVLITNKGKEPTPLAMEELQNWKYPSEIVF